MEKNLTFVNFRDMGGLETADGKHIKSGKLFRTCRIAPENNADKEFINSLKLDCVVDLRTVGEAKDKPDILPNSVEYVNAPAFTNPEYNAIAPSKELMKEILKGDAEYLEMLKSTIAKTYAEMPFENSAYGEIFKRMDDGKTIAFHCTAGKDRTGIGAMLIELALGRNIEDCKNEYLLSNQFREAHNKKLFRKLKFFPMKKCAMEFCKYALETHTDLFDIAVDEINKNYKDIYEFFEKAHNVDNARINVWKKYYLE